MVRIGVALLVSGFCIVLSLDLIYLYVYERWYDPSKAIEVAELATLGAIALLGVINAVFVVRSSNSEVLR